jgi:hypothetical protein
MKACLRILKNWKKLISNVAGKQVGIFPVIPSTEKLSFQKEGGLQLKCLYLLFFDIYPEDRMPILLDAVIEAIGETDYEMKSISGYVFIFKLSDRTFVISLAGLVIKTLAN